MKLGSKLIAIVLVAGVAPLGVFALTVLRTHQQAFDARTRELHRKAAEAGARELEQTLRGVERTLELTTAAVRWAELTPEERTGAVWLAFRQNEDFAAVALLDEEGEGIGGSAFVTAEGRAAGETHPAASLELLQRFAASLPFDRALREGHAVNPPFLAAGSAPLVPLARRVSGPGGVPWVVAAAFSLRTVCARLPAVAPVGATVYLVDPEGRALCDPRAAAPLTALAPQRAALLVPGAPAALRVAPPGEGELLAAAAPTSEGWHVVVEEPVAAAFASNRRILGQAAIWLLVAIGVAITAGLSLAGGITRPVRGVMEGARRLEAGEFEVRLPVQGQDELAALSAAFNRMGEAVQARDAEIRRWNEELTARVEERTRERNLAQEQLLQSQTLAAVAGMGAGLAHEVNNPLGAAIGLGQVLEAKLAGRGDPHADLPMVKMLLQEANRVRQIVAAMVELAKGDPEQPLAPIQVPAVVNAALLRFEEEAGAQGISLSRELADALPPVMGDAGKLQQVLEELVKNARTAMNGKGGQLRISAGAALEGRMVRIAVTDTGKGIAPEHLGRIFDPFFTTKDDWQSQGLGLTVAFKIIEAHHGTLHAESVPGKGTTMTVTLPAARSAHLV